MFTDEIEGLIGPRAMHSVLVSDSEQDRRNQRSVLGTYLFLASLAVAFIGMFVLYGNLRASMPAWPPPGLPRPPLALPTVNTVVVLLSSLAYDRALSALRQGRVGRFRLLLLATTNLGVLFLLLQVLLARQALEMGIVLGQSVYAGLLFGLTAFHAIHLIVGVCALAVLSALARRRRYSPRGSVELRLWGYYWHFVGVCWLVMYVLLFLL